jgi:hypothetical protein
MTSRVGRGWRDVGRWATGVALVHHLTSAGLALAALGGYTQFELNLIEAEPGTGMAGDIAVGDSAADANDHGLA